VETVVGWREWAALPELGIQRLAAKLDSGAHTCALHAVDIEPLETADGLWVRFRLDYGGPFTTAPLNGWRRVKDSGGHVTLRPTIQTTLWIGQRNLTIELTLADRSRMRHRLIIGRRTLRQGFLLHAGRTFLHEPVAPKVRMVRAAGFEPAIP
jgi:hypothetical protein